MPVYATEDANGRHRMLKYTPEHMHCLATVFGALAPPNTGVIAVQASTSNQQVCQAHFPPSSNTIPSILFVSTKSVKVHMPVGAAMT